MFVLMMIANIWRDWQPLHSQVGCRLHMLLAQIGRMLVVMDQIEV